MIEFFAVQAWPVRRWKTHDMSKLKIGSKRAVYNFLELHHVMICVQVTLDRSSGFASTLAIIKKNNF